MKQVVDSHLSWSRFSFWCFWWACEIHWPIISTVGTVHWEMQKSTSALLWDRRMAETNGYLFFIHLCWWRFSSGCVCNMCHCVTLGRRQGCVTWSILAHTCKRHVENVLYVVNDLKSVLPSITVEYPAFHKTSSLFLTFYFRIPLQAFWIFRACSVVMDNGN